MFPLHRYQEYGFTLTELLIAMAISSILLGGTISTFITQREFYVLQEQITGMVQSARAAMDMMIREIRMAGYNPARINFDGMTYDTSTVCRTLKPGPRIRADLIEDGDTNDSNEDITYCHDAENLRITRNTGGGNQPFAENIEAITFEYLDGDGNSTNVVADIRQIQITMTARAAKPDRDYDDPDNPDNNYRTYMLKSLITPRNLAY